MEVKIYTDGAARGNPNGPGGYGAVLLYVDSKGVTHRRELSGGYAKTTNNRMELMAAIVGLEALIRPCRVELYSDSQYLVKAFNEGWIDGWIRKGWKREKNKDVKNVDLWKRLLAAMEKHEVRFIWVKGHAGTRENERCDQLAVAAAEAGDLPEDPGLEACISIESMI
ncbi:MAG: ribonuclease HI [Eubacterium sp.]|nr:ribonuclease HI [Eubacterium sp.]